MAKPSVYVPDALVDALDRLYSGVSLSSLVQIGLVHLLARGPELTPSDRVRAAVAVERLQPYPNVAVIKAAEHALRTRKAGSFCERYLPEGRVAF